MLGMVGLFGLADAACRSPLVVCAMTGGVPVLAVCVAQQGVVRVGGDFPDGQPHPQRQRPLQLGGALKDTSSKYTTLV